MALDRAAPGFAYAGVAIASGEADVLAERFAPDIPEIAEPLYRVASISKIVTGQVFAEAAARRGQTPPYGLPVRAVLSWFAGSATLGQVASHTGGISDAAGYAIPADQSLQQFFEGHAEAVDAGRIGHFDYSNLGYILLAAVVEIWTGERFDRLATEWLARHGIAGGFNWSGVKDRGQALPTYRRGAAGFEAQVDTDLDRDGVLGPDGRALDLAHYVPGANPAVFSPQGGLRTSLEGLLRLARTLPTLEGAVLFRGDTSRDTVDPAATFESYGAGLQIFDAPAFYLHRLVGHFANAYGFVGGVWHDRDRDISFAYALNGLETGDDSDAFRPAELAVFEAVAKLEG